MPKIKIVKAVLAIICSEKDNEFLILKKQGAWTGWQFVQGAIDKGETEEQAVLREVKEETGLEDIKIIKKLENIKSDYWFIWNGEKIHKFMAFFLIKAGKTQQIKLSIEHSDYKWCSYEEALKEIKFNKEHFQKAYRELKNLK